MEIKAKLRYLRIAPRKARLVADLMRGKAAKEAKNILDFTAKKGALPLRKLLDQALANAKNNFQTEEKNLFISKIFVDEGPKLKRSMPRSRGTAMEIQKKTCHITLILEEKTAGKTKSGERVPKKNLAELAEKEKEIGVRPAETAEKSEKKEKAPLKGKSPKPEKRIKSKIEKKGLKRVFKRKSF